jgi:TatD DNase family protein
MKLKWIDTHTHIHVMPKKDRAGVIKRAREAGVRKMINVACNLEEIRQCLPLADEHDFIWTTVGLHPTDLTNDIERDLKEIHRYAKNGKRVVAIGEIGLDYYHDRFPHEIQLAFFAGQLDIARMLNLPAVIHCRASKNPGGNESAFVDLIEILEKMNFTNGVIHCFSGNKVEAEKLIDMGLMLSFTGIVTYESNEELREVIKKTPLDRIMIETDAPFLTPQAHRGKKNESAFVVEVAKVIAEVKKIPLEEVALQTSQNAEGFFGV